MGLQLRVHEGVCLLCREPRLVAQVRGKRKARSRHRKPERRVRGQRLGEAGEKVQESKERIGEVLGESHSDCCLGIVYHPSTVHCGTWDNG